MKLIIHRGTHEIGGSCLEVIGPNSRIVIDIGLPLVDTPDILPNVKGLYKWDLDNKKVDGVLISHPHMDHYGLFGYLRDDITYYLGRAAKKIIDMTCAFTNMKGSIKNYIAVESGKSVRIGDFKVTPYLMDHSAFDSYAFLIESNGKRLLYSGDFRNHGRKEKAFQYFLHACPKEVDALILEGTMFGRSNKPIETERDLEVKINKTISKVEGIVLANFSAQNIDRFVTMYRVAKRNNKIFAIDFYTANIVSMLGNSIPHPSKQFPEIRVFYPKRLSDKTAREGNINLMYKFTRYKISKPEMNEKANDIMILVRSSMIDDLKHLNLDNGLFIYSMWEGYLKEKSMELMLSYIKDKRIPFKHIHTSGHATVDTLKKVVDEINPKLVIPIHSFYPEDYRIISDNVKILKDGDIYEV